MNPTDPVHLDPNPTEPLDMTEILRQVAGLQDPRIAESRHEQEGVAR